MVFGELVDTVPIFGSQRKSYIVIGAGLMALGLLILAGAAGSWLTFARLDHLYVLGALLLSIGTVVQDVVADAMSTEVVERTDARGNDRPDHDVRVELGMVQLLGRLAVSAGVLAVAGLSGWLANFISRQGVFLIGLIIPAISVVGVFLRGQETAELRAIDWRILGGGIAFGVFVVALRVGRYTLWTRDRLFDLDGGGLLHVDVGDRGARTRDEVRHSVLRLSSCSPSGQRLRWAMGSSGGLWMS